MVKVNSDLDRFKSGVEAGVGYLSEKLTSTPEVGLVLGTGLGKVVNHLDIEQIIPYSDIPGFPVSTVISHAGNIVFGKIGNCPTVALQGRLHYYEGYSGRDVTSPIRILGLLGIRKLIVTNASGGLNPDFNPGDIMIIDDHINLIGDNPLRGPNIDEWGQRFPDMSKVYDPAMAETCRNQALESGLNNIRRGVYCAIAGPSLETPAETRFLRQIGADAVGMSTVPEVIVARHASIDVLGLSVIANVNDPDNFKPIEVGDILARMEDSASDLGRLLQKVVNSF